MPVQTTQARHQEGVTQFSVFTPNRLGRLNDLVGQLAASGVHVLAMVVLDTTDSAIIRIVVDDPDRARDLLARQGFPYSESQVVVVEVTADDLSRLMSVLLEAEININYLYTFIPHPRGKPVLALNLEDNEVALQALAGHQFRVLLQADLSR